MPFNEDMYAYGAAKSEIREIAAYGAARKAEIGADKVFDFSLGNPSVPAPACVREAIEQALALPSARLHGYTPASGLPEVRDAVATSLRRRFGRDAAQANDLYLTCGAAASLAMSFRALCAPGDEVIVIAPYFPEYKVFIEAASARCVEVPANPENFQIDVESVSSAITPRTKAVVINSPNNPTGVVYTRETLEALASLLHEKSTQLTTPIQLIADEPYREISYGAEVPWVPSIYEYSIVCYSYSKSLSLPGERIGWVLVPPGNPSHDSLVACIAGAGRALGYVCAPALFQHVIAACVDISSDVEAYAENREALTCGLKGLGYRYVEPDGAFYLWVRALEDDAQAFCAQARNYELLPVPSDSFGVPGWVRVSYCVDFDTISNSMPAWAELARTYA